ncbi:MAG TPA: 3-hydroxyacyl-ACP dehydratase FabZ [Armatimonadetes bacterium]|nr:3-hydroxyacyl-ACP dehydratase FabZ [Armatimonadota bacterium]
MSEQVVGGRSNVANVQDILPHRHPFLFVDRILELEPGKRAIGLKNVSVNEAFFQGHFPGYPIMPGVLILESMAQVSGLIILSMEEHRGKLGLLAGMERVRLRRPVLPGDQLITHAELVNAKGNICHIDAKAYVNDELVAECRFIMALQNERIMRAEQVNANR